MKQKVITIIATALTLVAIICHSEILTLTILLAGMAWCVGFIAHCIVHKEDEERYCGKDF